MSADMWLELSPGVSVSIDRAEALKMTEADFARFYRRHVLGAKRREAQAWARKQVELRASAVGAALPGLSGSTDGEQ